MSSPEQAERPERPERLRAFARRFAPARMQRIAIVAQADALRDALVVVAGSGSVELDEPADSGRAPGQAAQALQRMGAHPESGHGGATVMLSAAAPDVAELEHAGRADLLAGEAQLQRYAAAAVRRREVVAVAGWCPADQLPRLGARLDSGGATAVALPTPRGMDPPTLLDTRPGLSGSFSALVRTYGTVPYHDIDPTVWAGLAYTVMFGMMFGDVGHGLLLMVSCGHDQAGLDPPVPVAAADVEFCRWRRDRGKRLRGPVRGMLRPDRAGAGGMAGSAG